MRVYVVQKRIYNIYDFKYECQSERFTANIIHILL